MYKDDFYGYTVYMYEYRTYIYLQYIIYYFVMLWEISYLSAWRDSKHKRHVFNHKQITSFKKLLIFQLSNKKGYSFY